MTSVAWPPAAWSGALPLAREASRPTRGILEESAEVTLARRHHRLDLHLKIPLETGAFSSLLGTQTDISVPGLETKFTEVRIKAY